MKFHLLRTRVKLQLTTVHTDAAAAPAVGLTLLLKFVEIFLQLLLFFSSHVERSSATDKLESIIYCLSINFHLFSG